MADKRRLRFASIDGLDRSDLPLAAEVWLDETTRQSWISRDAIKLSVLFMRYITEPQDECLAIGRVERICQLDRDQVFETLRQMQLYGAVEAYTCHRDELHVSLNLTLLQRLRVLETRQRFIEQLTRAQHDRPLPARWKTNRWRPARSRTLMDAGDNVEQSGETATPVSSGQ